ncbi:hypothetical protein [Sodaliphilus sp.]|uniref:hypothetical protein n=1 Tax=Sodaliphilus sp. TaxID=2815818 RepID=UPI00388D5308
MSLGAGLAVGAAGLTVSAPELAIIGAVVVVVYAIHKGRKVKYEDPYGGKTSVE